MKVLQLHAGYRVPAGEDTVVASEADALTAGGHDVRRHVVSNPSELTGAIKALSLSLHNPQQARAVTAEIAEFEPDVVHVHNTWFALSSSVIGAAGAADVPVVMTLHNYRLGCLGADLFRGDAVCTACVGRLPLRGILHGCYRDSRLLSTVAAAEVSVTRRRGTLAGNVDRFVAPSGFMADRLVEIGVPADRLVVKPHFIDDPGPRSAVPSTSNEVLFIGRLARGKGLESLLRAWEHVNRAGGPDDIELAIIGDGPLADELREGAPRGVRFDGWLPRDDVIARMLRARAFVFPSAWYEPFGMVLLEALAAGLPIIVTAASEAPKITGAPESLVVPIGDERALAGAISSLSDAAVDEIGAANRDRYEAMYTPQVGLRLLEELYAGVLQDAGGGPLR
ncbi:MAG: glycosyltransferase family 4 protein [Ilumatobacter sp.]|nr:glycosyltransferase family 4 protein [Ilumatobacter sp.]